MLSVYWSPKGGSGTSVVAASVALLAARAGRSVLLVDLAGDLPAVLGCESGPGATEWMASPDAPPDALATFEVDVADSLRLLPLGSTTGAHAADRRRVLVDLCSLRADVVVLDAGTLRPGELWWEPATRSVAVVRSCYLGLRRLAAADVHPDDVVLIEEPGRALGRRDAQAALAAPVLALPWDPAVARSVDAGLLAHRLPRSLHRLRPTSPVRER